VSKTGALSVWERPTRVILTGLTLTGAGVLAALSAERAVAVIGAAAGTALGAVAVVQLGFSLRRMLGD
jgi:CDP-diacylglycerol--glycerol-3-phosphate 3-phosphatidyltransferase